MGNGVIQLVRFNCAGFKFWKRDSKSKTEFMLMFEEWRSQEGVSEGPGRSCNHFGLADMFQIKYTAISARKPQTCTMFECR